MEKMLLALILILITAVCITASAWLAFSSIQSLGDSDMALALGFALLSAANAVCAVLNMRTLFRVLES